MFVGCDGVMEIKGWGGRGRRGVGCWSRRLKNRITVHLGTCKAGDTVRYCGPTGPMCPLEFGQLGTLIDMGGSRQSCAQE